MNDYCLVRNSMALHGLQIQGTLVARSPLGLDLEFVLGASLA